MTSDTNATFESVKARLDEIVDAVGDESISLDDALDLYEEAVKLGMQASTLLEEGIAQQEAEGLSGGEDDADGMPREEGLEAARQTEGLAEQAQRADDAESQRE
ncbi:exodeoxyribonuclease VII small subunit [Raoultibacter phocaeensis]|uniref:exodeoxyribonuclease VII small subunit n=1 Tax=Raoultibacter phocaeensis TaxID=2479841 RepID=UPI00111A5D51|nr:exodeoxyribonuclease VII small subunit [Raoultibacter phocaeensis]